MKRFFRNILRRSTRFELGAWLYNFQIRERTSRRVKAGYYHEKDFEFFTCFAGKRAIIVDVGANVGQSIVSFKTAAPDCVIHSFEPNPSIFRFAERVAHRYSDVFVYQVALGPAEGVVELFIPRYRHMYFYELASTLERDIDQLRVYLRDQGFSFLRDDTLSLDKVCIAARPLDSLGLSPAAIKIDVEGAELGVLNGAWDTLKRFQPILLLESGDRPEISSRLRGLGYKSYFYDPVDGALKSGIGNLNTFYLV